MDTTSTSALENKVARLQIAFVAQLLLFFAHHAWAAGWIG